METLVVHIHIVAPRVLELNRNREEWLEIMLLFSSENGTLIKGDSSLVLTLDSM